MKKISYLFIVVLSIFTLNVKTKAVCNLEEEKAKASKIEVTYDINMDAYQETGKYNKYIIRFNNISNSIKIYDSKTDRTFAYFANNDYVNDRSYATDYNVGTHYFKVYSSYCTSAISSITVKIPKFNEYSQDPLCEGISENELSICGKWFDNSNISYNDFVKTINNYKNNNDENGESGGNNDSNVVNNNDSWFNVINDFVRKNYLYVAGGAIVVLALIIVLIAIRRKRGRLE